MGYSTKLMGLLPLYKSMLKSNRSHEHFRVNYANEIFDCILYIDTTPFELLMGMVGSNWGTVVQIEKGFNGSMADCDFYKLCNLLHLTPQGGSFTSSLFLKHIANSSPKAVSALLIPPHVLTRLDPRRLTDIEEPDKIFFTHWLPQTTNLARNINKTEKLIGREAAEFCKKHNISSCWSSDPNKYRPPVMPWNI